MSDTEKKAKVTKNEFAQAVFGWIKGGSKDFLKECNEYSIKKWKDFSDDEYKTLKWESYMFYFWLTSKLLKKDKDILDIIHEDLFLAPIVPELAKSNNTSESAVWEFYRKEFAQKYSAYNEASCIGESREGGFPSRHLIQCFFKNAFPARDTLFDFVFTTNLTISVASYFLALGKLRSKIELE